MKKYNIKKIIGCSIGIICMAVLASFFLFKNLNTQGTKTNEEETQYLLSIRNKYVGDSSADMKILNELRIAENLKIEIKSNDVGVNSLIINLNGEKTGNLSYEEYGAILLALIDNLDEICWNINGSQNIKITVDGVAEKYGNVKECGKTFEKLHSLLVNMGYYERR